MCRFSTTQPNGEPRRYPLPPRAEESSISAQSTPWLFHPLTTEAGHDHHVENTSAADCSESPESISNFEIGALDNDFDALIGSEDFANLFDDDDLSLPHPPAPVLLSSCPDTPSSTNDSTLLSTIMRCSTSSMSIPTARLPAPMVAPMASMPHRGGVKRELPASGQSQIHTQFPAYPTGAMALHEMQTMIKQNLEMLSSRMPVVDAPNHHKSEYKRPKVDEIEVVDPLEEVKKKRRESAQRSRARKNEYVKALELENKMLQEENAAMKRALAKMGSSGSMSVNMSMNIGSAPTSHQPQQTMAWSGENCAQDMSSLMAMYGLGMK